MGGTGMKKIIIAFLTATIMAMCMSFIMAIVNVGFSPVLVSVWLKGWMIGTCVAFPLSYFLPPKVTMIVNEFIK